MLAVLRARWVPRSLGLGAAALACALSALCAPLANAADHVLIMTVSGYPKLRAPLPGAMLDGKNALALAAKLGFQTTGPNVRLLREAELSGDGIQRAVAAVAAKVETGDRLFLYFSGHGTSYPVQEGCAEALVPFDATPDPRDFVRTSELIRSLDGARDKLSDAFVFFDACHAGGLREVVAGSSRAMPGQDGPENELRAKSVRIRGGEQCLTVANKSTMESYTREAQGRGLFTSVRRNFTFVAAARENEEALDSAAGGLATTAMLECANRGVGNLSQTGVVSVDELRQCAQGIIDSRVPVLSKIHRPHHLEVHGNSARMLVGVQALPPATSVSARTDADRVEAAFEQVVANSNPNLGFRAWLSDRSVPLGTAVTLSYESKVDGYMTVLYVGSDRQHIAPLMASRRVVATPGFTIGPSTITAPAGTNRMLVLITARPIAVEAMLTSARRGDKVSLSAAVAQNLACAAGMNRNMTDFGLKAPDIPDECRKRNMSGFADEAPAGSAPPAAFVGYGAQLLEVIGR